MSSKYFICNDIRFLSGNAEWTVSPDSGSHMKHSQVTTFVNKHPTYTYYKARSSKKGNDYVIATAMKFIGNDSNIVSDIKKARVFNSADSAYEHLENCRNDIDSEIQYVVNEKFVRQKRAKNVQAKDINPLELVSFEGQESSERVYIPQRVKDIVFAQSGGVCPICKRALYKQNSTIDHIIPLSRGGTNDPMNLRAVHSECNRLKGNFLDKEFAETVRDVSSGEIYAYPMGKFSIQMFRAAIRGFNVMAKQYSTRR